MSLGDLEYRRLYRNETVGSSKLPRDVHNLTSWSTICFDSSSGRKHTKLSVICLVCAHLKNPSFPTFVQCEWLWLTIACLRQIEDVNAQRTHYVLI